jgi:hypothetical protein
VVLTVVFAWVCLPASTAGLMFQIQVLVWQVRANLVFVAASAEFLMCQMHSRFS